MATPSQRPSGKWPQGGLSQAARPQGVSVQLLPQLCDLGQAPQTLWALLSLLEIQGKSSDEKAPTSPTPSSAGGGPSVPHMRVSLGQAQRAQSRERAMQVSPPPGQMPARAPDCFPGGLGRRCLKVQDPRPRVHPSCPDPPQALAWPGAEGPPLPKGPASPTGRPSLHSPRKAGFSPGSRPRD